jgi:hypothetical protein
MSDKKKQRPGPYVEDIVVIRRRLRINNDKVEGSLKVWASSADDELILGVLERAKWFVLEGEYTHEEGMKVEGLMGADDKKEDKPNA